MVAVSGSLFSLFAASPASTNFTLQNYDFGNGGATASSSSYNLNGTVGTQTGEPSTNGVTSLSSGTKPVQNANVPPAAALSNPDSSYNKLRAIVNTGGNPADTKFAIAISSDNFATTKYIQNDNSVGTVLGIEDFQTYAQWGSATGFDILGLAPNTSYAVKVTAFQGNFTASGFGPASTAVATQATSVSFSVTTSASATPPFTVNFPSLAANTVYAASSNAVIGISSNAAFGGGIYIRDANGGLQSPSKSFTITSTTADLAVAASGFGSQAGSLSQTSGGPLTAIGPFNGTADSVGGLSPTLQQILGTSGPISGGSGQILFKAKTTTGTPAADDYADRMTFVAAMSF